jgi:hypothetical protein
MEYMKTLNFRNSTYLTGGIHWLAWLFVLQSCSIEKLYNLNHLSKTQSFEQVDFKNLMERYVVKEATQDNKFEGIYSVSILITKRYKPLLSSTFKEKVVEQKQNYSTVAIIHENNKNAGREYLEIPIDQKLSLSYSVRGEFTATPEGGILIYKHFERKGKIIPYTFSTDLSNNLLEGIRTENQGTSIITYKLSYLRLLPKNKN